MVLECCHIQYTLRKLNLLAQMINGLWVKGGEEGEEEVDEETSTQSIDRQCHISQFRC